MGRRVEEERRRRPKMRRSEDATAPGTYCTRQRRVRRCLSSSPVGGASGMNEADIG